MEKLSYLKGYEYIAECFINEDFVKKLGENKLKEKFTKDFNDMFEKYLFLSENKKNEKWVDNYEDYQNASNDATYSQYPFFRG